MFVAKKYEAILLEKVGTGLTEERILLVFRILDQVLPQLGVFSKVVKKMRDEIFGNCFTIVLNLLLMLMQWHLPPEIAWMCSGK